MGASILDFLIVTLPLSFLIGILFEQSLNEDNPIFDLFSLSYNIIVPVLWSGYVVGKRILGIRIVRVDGRNIHIGNMIMRVFIAGIVYGLTLGIGLIVSAFMVAMREDKRSIHDFIAGTYVTYSLPDET